MQVNCSGRYALVGAAALALMIVSALDGWAGKPCFDTPVTSLFEDEDFLWQDPDTGEYFTITPRIRSDGGSYSEGILESGDDWELDLKGSPRMVRFDFSQPQGGTNQLNCTVGGDPANPALCEFGSTEIAASPRILVSDRTELGSEANCAMLSMAPGSSFLFALWIEWEGISLVDGALYTYRLASNPVNIAGTTGVTVTRIESNTWVLDAGVAALSKARTVKGKQAVTQLGNFHMPMRVTVTNP